MSSLAHSLPTPTHMRPSCPPSRRVEILTPLEVPKAILHAGLDPNKAPIPNMSTGEVASEPSAQARLPRDLPAQTNHGQQDHPAWTERAPHHCSGSRRTLPWSSSARGGEPIATSSHASRPPTLPAFASARALPWRHRTLQYTPLGWRWPFIFRLDSDRHELMRQRL